MIPHYFDCKFFFHERDGRSFPVKWSCFVVQKLLCGPFSVQNFSQARFYDMLLRQNTPLQGMQQ